MWMWRYFHHKFTTPLDLKLSVKLVVFIGLLLLKLPKKIELYALNSQNHFQPKLLLNPSLWLSHLIIALKVSGTNQCKISIFHFIHSHTLSHQPQPLHIHEDHQGITHTGGRGLSESLLWLQKWFQLLLLRWESMTTLVTYSYWLFSSLY